MRHIKQRLLAHAILMLTLAVPWTVHAQGSAGQQDVGWPSYSNDLGGMRFQNIDQINPRNVARLKPAWVFHTNVVGQHTSFEAQPIVADDTLFVTSPHDHVFALDPTTGKVKWTYSPTDMPPLAEIAACCGQNNRGVAVGDGMVFIARLDATLVALDEKTGQVAWQTSVADWHDKWSETMASLFVDGKVIVGGSGGEFLKRGFVDAYDAKTGQRLWRFHTVAGPGEQGRDSWDGDSWKTGGGTVWTTPVADPSLGLLYVPTGNAAPDLNGSKRKGDNLFTASIVALELGTGKLRWYFQEVHHDLWDYDAAQPPQLFTLDRNGQSIPALGHANKDGYYFILDRRIGKPIYTVTEKSVPSGPKWQNASATQPVPATERLIPDQVEKTPNGMRSAPMFTPPSEHPTIIQPGFEAGPEWTPSAYSPRTHDAYIEAGGYQPWNYHAIEQHVNTLASSAVPKIPGVQNWGLLDAVDTTTGKIAWRYRSPHKLVSGVAVAGNLVFFGESQGQFDAADAKTGKLLWSFKRPQSDVKNVGGANGSPAVYVADGKEYVVMAFGGNDHVRLSDESPTGDALIAFAIDAGNINVVQGQPKQVETGGIPKSAMVEPRQRAPSGAHVVKVETHDYNFHPEVITASPGEKVAVHIVNTGVPPAGMAVKLPSGPIALKGPVKPHKDAYFVFTAPEKPGAYPIFSPLPNQKFFGMIGELRVGSDGKSEESGSSGK